MKKIFLIPALIASVNLLGQLPGHYCGTTPSPLTGNFEMALDKFDYNFTGKRVGTNHVNIGYPCNTPTGGKLNIRVDTTTSPYNPSSYGIYVENHTTSNHYEHWGIFSQAINLSGTITGEHGVVGSAIGGHVAMGIQGIGNTGGIISSSAGYGGHFVALGTNIGTNYGIYASADNSLLNNYAGYFDGDVVINAGSGTYALTVNGSSWQSAGTAWATSDKKFKKNIVRLEGITEKLKKVNGYSYSFKTEEFPDRHFDKTPTIGFMAQELKEVFPQLVMTDPNGDLAVNYQGMIPVLLESIKEQQKQLDEQKELINQLMQRSNTATGINSVDLISGSFRMEQNEPNPFTHETLINYSLPESVRTSYLIVYDLTGKQITSLPITQKGSGAITITSEKLSPGIYIYSIVADGKVVDSKRMIVAEK